MNLYSLPSYLEADPTLIMFLTFPLFFGFMLGDVGYGLVTLALFYVASTKVKGEAKALANALMVASLATILFGFVFGEFFGLEFIEHPLLERATDISTMLLVTVVVGFIHINLGYVVGFFNVLKEHGLKDAILEKASWLVIEAGMILAAAGQMGYIMSEATYAGAAVFVLGIAMLLKGEGITGVIELPALFSNILSYTRLFAVGLASVSLALVINKFATQFMQQGGIYVPVAILVLLVGHTINIMLGILGPFLHSLRLHYVEFFTKFFKGGGERFIPFGYEE
jgi:V/A-type H+-transporting ATPase subunit I